MIHCQLNEGEQALAQEKFAEVPDAKAILEMFIEWANRHETDEELKLQYAEFFKLRNLTRVEYDISVVGGRWLQIRASDGGEGGPNDITAYFENDAGQWALIDILLRFDLTAQVIWSTAQGGYVAS